MLKYEMKPTEMAYHSYIPRTIMIRWPSTVEEEGVEVNQSKRRVCVLTRELIKVTLRRMGMI